MGAWGTAIFSDDLAQDIRREYNILLSVGKDNYEVEEMLINYYSDILDCNNSDEEVFWFALALCEWKKGRLSDGVKNKALYALDRGGDLERWNTVGNMKNYEKRKKVLNEFRDVILSPMPSPKKIRKPTVHHCPWKEGSLLGYRIVSAEDVLRNHPCFMKYVLLRVVKVNQLPVSKVFDTKYYDETMWVGLYNWIGSTIPDSEIISNLRYIPVKDFILPLKVNHVDLLRLDSISQISKDVVNRDLNLSFSRKIEKCVQLDWLPSKYAKGDITYLGCDENFQEHIPEFFGQQLKTSTLTNFLPFDVTLAKRFEPYVGNEQNFDFMII